MALTNYERVNKAMDLLRDGLAPFVDRELRSIFGDQAAAHIADLLGTPIDAVPSRLEAAALLTVMRESWSKVFQRTLGPAEQALIKELSAIPDRLEQQQSFAGDDAYRALDSTARLLSAISAPQAQETERMKMELLRVRFDEQVRSEKRKSSGTAIESQATGASKPWREVVTPHKDVASGRYQQAEFAADLWQVRLNEGTEEYRNPAEFFRRTYLTESLKQLLVGAVRRLTGQGADPVVQLQTNFGGGKTHSMLALYHLVSGAAAGDLLGVDDVLVEAGVDKLPTARRVVLVGNKISPGNPSIKNDGTVVQTLWGELAWQLGGRAAFDRVRADDERSTNPGDTLRELFNEHEPCLVLIDEWVAYARQLHDQSDLPAGSFETQFSFAQALTESAKLARNTLLVVSLPASDTASSRHAQADDVEVGGQRGREALERLRNVIGRVESSWRPASAEEGFEIVRRRLFDPLVDQAQFLARDTVAREFYDLYRTQHQEFPPECREPEYERRIRAAYPIHPEIFDRLYTDWSTLLKFQRTRGVLRLMAAVIHSLWEKGDRNPLILPCNVPIDDPRIQRELTRYLSDNWVPVIEKDVDGASSLPMRLDGEVPNLGKYSACRRVARTIYLGSAPTQSAANRGLEDRRIKLGCVMPGEAAAVFGDALRRLAGAATYLYADGPRYWYSTQPTVTKVAEDRTEQLKRDPDRVILEILRRLERDAQTKGDFAKVHPMPASKQEVADEREARLVILHVDQPYAKESDNPAEMAARALLEQRGNVPRRYRNSLVFAAVDRVKLQDLDEAVRRYLAWTSIVDEKNVLDLSPHQVKQAGSQRDAADAVVATRMNEAYQWMLVPTQAEPAAPVAWQIFRVTGQESLAARVSKKLRSEELLLSGLAPSRLRHELDRVPLWRGGHVEIKQLAEDFAQYIYLPRLRGPNVLTEAIRGGLEWLTWEKDSFAFADSYDEPGRRYRGLQAGRPVRIRDADSNGLLVKPDVARDQMDTETPASARSDGRGGSAIPGTADVESLGSPGSSGLPTTVPAVRRPRRFHGSVSIDPARVGREAGRIGDEIISHLAGLVGTQVRITLEIAVEVPEGTPEPVVRTVTENCRALKFSSHGFEED